MTMQLIDAEIIGHCESCGAPWSYGHFDNGGDVKGWYCEHGSDCHAYDDVDLAQ